MEKSSTSRFPPLLFIIPALIWGSTWYIIKFQLGTVSPVLSVAYRFLIAGVLLLSYCLLTKKKLILTLRQHLLVAVQSCFLFGLNYWMVYRSEHYLTSGLVAVVFSTLIFLNMFFGSLFLKSPIEKKVLVGAVLGVIGTVLIFRPELKSIDFSDDIITGLAYAVTGTVFASLGNIASAYTQRKNVPVIQGNAFGMLYGGTVMMGIAILSGTELRWDMSLSYSLSLLYLAIFGSIVAFGTYLTLIGNIGADKAAYVLVIIPVISLLISTFSEGYQWTWWSIFGALFIVMGNTIALRKSKK